MDRDLCKYQETYRLLPFERHQAYLRRKEILETISYYKPMFWTEVGCAMSPLFTDYKLGIVATVIEPASIFYDNLSRLKIKNPHINTCIFNNRLEELNINYRINKIQDLVVLSGILHEISNSKEFLNSAKKLGNRSTKYIFTVPNAQSVHRKLALRTGQIDNLYQLSEQQVSLQQKKVYCVKTLTEELENNGFIIEAIKTIILKPFTHKQMQEILDFNILTKEEIYIFSEMVDISSSNGSEILVVANHSL